MINLEWGVVQQILWARKELQCLEVDLKGKKEKALNYVYLTGSALPGQQVIVNTTAVRLGLGSGGYHFVLINITRSLQAELSREYYPHRGKGHIIKLRYTPLQMRVATYEEKLIQRKPLYALKKHPGLLKGIPVIIGELHSMLAPFVFSLKKLLPHRKIVYIMSDSASLPLSLSNTVDYLKEKNLLAGTVTYGHAFGGDVETVNIYTALMAAKDEFNPDVIIITPGPGVVGTSTRYGYSGIEQGEHLDRVNKLGGVPVVIPRVSFSDLRSRHFGISHHTLTSLGEIATSGAFLPLADFDKERKSYIFRQLQSAGIFYRHKVILIKEIKPLPYLLNKYLPRNFNFNTMGRDIKKDPDFFASPVAAAIFTGKKIEGLLP